MKKIEKMIEIRNPRRPRNVRDLPTLTRDRRNSWKGDGINQEQRETIFTRNDLVDRCVYIQATLLYYKEGLRLLWTDGDGQ